MTGSVADRTDSPTTPVRRGPGFWTTWLVDVLVVAAVFGPLADGVRAFRQPGLLLGYAGLWIVIALAYVGIRLGRLRRSRRDVPGWEQRLIGRRMAYLVTAATAFQVFGYGLTIPVFASTTDLLPGGAVTGKAILAVSVVVLVVAWAVLHLSYAERYARLWLREAEQVGGQPIAFPGTPSPRLRDFAYFAVTVGVSFATSDAEIRSSTVRAVVLWHSVLSFAFNTAILGMVVGLIAA